MAVSSQPFAGFTPEAIQFLTDLAENNDRGWFPPRKADYERLLKAPLEALCAALADRFAERSIPLQADPRRSPFRIYRDTRFSRDKSPYKTHLGASFPWVGTDRRGGEAGRRGRPCERRLLQLPAGRDVRGGGMWMPEKPRLDALRRAIVETPDRVREALEEPAFVAWFGGVRTHDSLKRIPAGFPAGPPDGRHVPLEGRHLRPPALRRRGLLSGPSGPARRRLRSGAPGVPLSRDAPVAAEAGFSDRMGRRDRWTTACSRCGWW